MGIVNHGIPKEITLKLAILNHAKVFIETGTFRGETTRWAAQHFDLVYTIERSTKLFETYAKELAQIKGVTPLLGDSRDVLPEILKEIGNQKAVFWLDGHWSGGDTYGANDECPLLDEINKLTNRYDDVILIDDARLFLSAPPRPHNPQQWPTIAEIVQAMSTSQRNPYFQVVDDVIFVMPRNEQIIAQLTSYAQDRADAFWTEFRKYQVNSQGKFGLKNILRKVRQLI